MHRCQQLNGGCINVQPVVEIDPRGCAQPRPIAGAVERKGVEDQCPLARLKPTFAGDLELALGDRLQRLQPQLTVETELESVCWAPGLEPEVSLDAGRA